MYVQSVLVDSNGFMKCVINFVKVHIWKSEVNLQHLFFSIHDMSTDRVQGTKLGSSALVASLPAEPSF